MNENKKYYSFESLDKEVEKFFNNYVENKKEFENSDIQNNITITGPWGIGKTTLINYWIDYHENSINNNIYKFIKINVWEFDLSEYPFYSILTKIASNISVELKKKIDKLNKKRKWKFGIKPEINYNDINYALGIFCETEKINNKYLDFDEKINETVYIINKAIKEKIVIVFDELDRLPHNRMLYFMSLINNIFFKINKFFL